MWAPGFRALAVGTAAVLPPIVLAEGDRLTLALAGALVPILAALARTALSRLSPELARSYPIRRLGSLRYLGLAFALPIACAIAIATSRVAGLAATAVVHGVLAHRYRARFTPRGAFRVALVGAALGGLGVALERLALRGQEWRLGGSLLHAEETARQRIVLVERESSLELFIDGELQFRSADEALYHDGLLAPVAELGPSARDVLILGGGDGLAARDLLKASRARRVVIVDWDRAVTRLCRSTPSMVALNGGALEDPRVEIIHDDVRVVLRTLDRRFDAVVGDLCDPNPASGESFPLSAAALFLDVRRLLSPGGLFVTHASSAAGSDVEREIRGALERAGFSTRSYSRTIPSFGDVAYVVGRPGEQLPSSSAA